MYTGYHVFIDAEARKAQEELDRQKQDQNDSGINWIKLDKFFKQQVLSGIYWLRLKLFCF
jgi:hypothetical protein